jgi:hypothetical protein
VSTELGIEEESTMDGNDDRIIKLADRMPADMRYVAPSTFLSTDCRVNYILTEGSAKFRQYGDVGADHLDADRLQHQADRAPLGVRSMRPTYPSHHPIFNF